MLLHIVHTSTLFLKWIHYSSITEKVLVLHVNQKASQYTDVIQMEQKR